MRHPPTHVSAGRYRTRTGRRHEVTQAISPVGCCLARDGQRPGMSTKKDAVIRSGDFLWWTVQDSNRAAAHSAVSKATVRLLLSPRWPTARNVYQERTKAGYHHGGGALPFCFVFPYIALFGLIAAYIHTWSVRTYAGKRAGSDI